MRILVRSPLAILCLLALSACRLFSVTLDGPHSYGAHLEVGPLSAGLGSYGGDKSVGLRNGQCGYQQSEWLGWIIPLKDSYKSRNQTPGYDIDLNKSPIGDGGIWKNCNFGRIALAAGFVFGLRVELNPIAPFCDLYDKIKDKKSGNDSN